MRLDPGRAHGRLRARDPRRGRSRRTRSSRCRSTAPASRAVLACGPRLLLLPAGQPRRRLARLDLLGPPEHALGRDRAVGGAARRTPADARLVAGGPRSRSSSPSGTPTGGCTSSPTATAGGTSTGPTRASERRAALTRPRRPTSRHPQWLFGGATYAFLDDGAIACVRCERGEERLFAARARGRAPARPRPALHLLRLPRRSRPAASAVAFAAGQPGERDRGRRLRRRAAASRGGAQRQRRAGRPGLRLAPAADRVPDRRRRGRPRLLLPADQPRLRGAGGRAAAADRREPRRPDLPRHPRARPRVPLLDQPRHRRRRRQLPRQQRLRPRLPRARCAASWGVVDTEDCVAAAPLPGRAAARPTASGWRSAAAAPAATRPSARSPSTTTSPPAPATTASPTPRRSPATPTSSSRATSTA